MDNSRLLRTYVSPISEMMRRKMTLAEQNAFDSRVNEFYRQCSQLETKRFIEEMQTEFGHEVNTARFVVNDLKISIIARNMLFFFWMTILSIIVSFLYVLASLS